MDFQSTVHTSYTRAALRDIHVDSRRYLLGYRYLLFRLEYQGGLEPPNRCFHLVCCRYPKFWSRFRESNSANTGLQSAACPASPTYIVLVFPDGFEPSSSPCQSDILPLNYGNIINLAYLLQFLLDACESSA